MALSSIARIYSSVPPQSRKGLCLPTSVKFEAVLKRQGASPVVANTPLHGTESSSMHIIVVGAAAFGEFQRKPAAAALLQLHIKT